MSARYFLMLDNDAMNLKSWVPSFQVVAFFDIRVIGEGVESTGRFAAGSY